jgi:hypothetical protein
MTYQELKEKPEFLKVMSLWISDGYVWDIVGNCLYLTFLIPGDKEHDSEIGVDLIDYSYACYNPHNNECMCISHREHKLITKTVNVIKKTRRIKKEVENAN